MLGSVRGAAPLGASDMTGARADGYGGVSTSLDVVEEREEVEEERPVKDLEEPEG